MRHLKYWLIAAFIAAIFYPPQPVYADATVGNGQSLCTGYTSTTGNANTVGSNAVCGWYITQGLGDVVPFITQRAYDTIAGYQSTQSGFADPSRCRTIFLATEHYTGTANSVYPGIATIDAVSGTVQTSLIPNGAKANIVLANATTHDAPYIAQLTGCTIFMFYAAESMAFVATEQAQDPNTKCMALTNGNAGTSLACMPAYVGSVMGGGSGAAFTDIQASGSKIYLPVTGMSEASAATNAAGSVALFCGQPQQGTAWMDNYILGCTTFHITPTLANDYFDCGASGDGSMTQCDPFTQAASTYKSGWMATIDKPRDDSYAAFWIHDYIPPASGDSVSVTFQVNGSNCSLTTPSDLGTGTTNVTVATELVAAAPSGAGCTGLNFKRIVNTSVWATNSRCGSAVGCGIGIRVTSGSASAFQVSNPIGNVTACTSASGTIHCGNDAGGGGQTPPFAASSEVNLNTTSHGTGFGAGCRYEIPNSGGFFYCYGATELAVNPWNTASVQSDGPAQALWCERSPGPDATGLWTWTDCAGNNSFTSSPIITSGTPRGAPFRIGNGIGGSIACSSGTATITQPGGAPSTTDFYTLPLPCSGNSVCTAGSCGIPATMNLFDYNYSMDEQAIWSGATHIPVWLNFSMTLDSSGNLWFAWLCNDTSGNRQLCYGEWSKTNMQNLALGFVDSSSTSATIRPNMALATAPSGNLILDVGVGSNTAGAYGCVASGGTCLVSYTCTKPCAGTWTRSILKQYSGADWTGGCPGGTLTNAAQVSNMFDTPEGDHTMFLSLMGSGDTGNHTQSCIRLYDHFTGNL